MFGRRPEPPPAQRVVIGKVRSAPPLPPDRDEIGKQTGQPQGVVAQMHLEMEAAFRGATLLRQIVHNFRQIVVGLVIDRLRPDRPVLSPEFEQQGGQVIGDLPLIQARQDYRIARAQIEAIIGRDLP